jgi:hypothetical protein
LKPLAHSASLEQVSGNAAAAGVPFDLQPAKQSKIDAQRDARSMPLR